MKILIVIPARFSSSRYPGKPLAKILGKPMINHVCEAINQVNYSNQLIVATDSLEILNHIQSSGINGMMTDKTALTGTDRLAEVAEQIDADIYVNIQGDEPLANSTDIETVISAKLKHMNCVVNGYSYIKNISEVKSKNVPKVVLDTNSRLLYASRQAIPSSKTLECTDTSNYLKQVCIYAYTKEELQIFARLKKKTFLESLEDIEILRFCELGIPVYMVKLSSGTAAVDIPDDVSVVEHLIMRKRINSN